MAATAEQVRIILSGPTFEAAVATLRAELIDPVRSYGYVRPTTSSLQSAIDRQHIPALPGSEDLIIAERHIALHHLHMAMANASVGLSPFANHGGTAKARPDLAAAVDWVASFATQPGNLHLERRRRMHVFSDVAHSLAPHDAQLQDLMTYEASGVQQQGASPAFIAAAIRATGLPDLEFTACQVHGFPCIGDIPDSGLFRSVERPATKNFNELFHPLHNQLVAQSILDAASRASLPSVAKERHMIDAIYTKTQKEVSKHLAFGPFTADEIDTKFCHGRWRALHRFGVEQGFEEDGVTPKIRPCDNGKSGLHNLCASFHETIACEDATFPMLVADLFADAFHRVYGAQFPMQHATDDVDSAYRRLAAAHPEATVVAIFDPTVNDVRYYTMNGFPFGLASAVTAFNRNSQLMSCLGRRLFGLCTCAFFDDHDTTEPVYAGKSSKICLRGLYRWLGMPLVTGDNTKDVAFAQSNPFLGVISDLSRFVHGEAYLRSKPSRVAHIVATIDRFVTSNEISGDPLYLFGKLEYLTSSAGYFRFGRAALTALRDWYGSAAPPSEDGPLPDDVLDALAFYRTVLPRLPTRVFRFGPNRQRLPPLVVYSDAMYEATATTPARIGIFIFDPLDVGSADAPAGFRHCSAIVPDWLLGLFKPRKQQIGPLETLAAVCAIISRPTQFRGREVIHFIDNTQALYSLAGGSSRQVDCSRLVHVYQCLIAALQAQVWFEYCPSGANIADLPSRDDFRLLLELESVPFDVRWPDMASEWGGVFDRIFDEFAPPPSKAEKRARAQVNEAVALEIDRRKFSRA